jgi:hypothetical protein
MSKSSTMVPRGGGEAGSHMNKPVRYRRSLSVVTLAALAAGCAPSTVDPAQADRAELVGAVAPAVSTLQAVDTVTGSATLTVVHEGTAFSCRFVVTHDREETTNPETGDPVYVNTFTGSVDCPDFVGFAATASLVDQTLGFEDRRVGSSGNTVRRESESHVSTGVADLDANTARVSSGGARVAEAHLRASLGTGSNEFGGCTASDLRIVRCDGEGRNFATVEFSTLPVDTGVSESAQFCPKGSFIASSPNGDTRNPGPFQYREVARTQDPLTGLETVLARPTVKALWCADAIGATRGNVTKLKVISVSPNRLVTELDARTSGNTTPVASEEDGFRVYELNFDFEYEFKVDYAIGPVVFKAGTKCAVAIHLTYTNQTAPRSSETVNTCDPWIPLGV